MYIQNFIINRINPNASNELYYRRSLFYGNNKNDDFCLSYDTYFNLLNYKLFVDKCNAGRCRFFMICNENVLVNLCLRKKNNEVLILECNNYIPDSKEPLFNIDLKAIEDEGYIFIQVKDSKNTIIDRMYFEIDTLNNHSKISIAICTYNREKFVLHNVNVLEKFCSSTIENVFVVNNGGDINLKTNNFIKLIKNKNYGGTGGFTSGMIHSIRNGSTHVFLMDDDICFEPEIINRCAFLIKSLNEENINDWVGFSMISLDDPNIQYAMGSSFYGENLDIINHNANFNLTDCKTLLINDVDKCGWTAWWSAIIPLSFIEKKGLPFPFFIKVDDIEFSYRDLNKKIIFNNSFGVWHESFEKKQSRHLYYYDTRNYLIIKSVYDLISYKDVVKSYIKNVGKAILNKHMHDLLLYLKAIEHFMVGPRFFRKAKYDLINKEIMNISKCKINFIIIIKSAFKSAFYFIKIVFAYKIVCKKYKKNFNNLSSNEFWENKLGI